ncbi:hypothetical protein CSPX01_00652 [Colletotrichum filicis]|nr:hypothetical protein CSPX01_00652 [Colletotrichum filicis]
MAQRLSNSLLGLWFITWCEVSSRTGALNKTIGRLAEDDALERLALNCWRGSFVSIHCLKEAVMDVPGSQDMAEAVNWTAEYRLEMRQKCEALLGQVAQS